MKFNHIKNDVPVVSVEEYQKLIDKINHELEVGVPDVTVNPYDHYMVIEEYLRDENGEEINRGVAACDLDQIYGDAFTMIPKEKIGKIVRFLGEHEECFVSESEDFIYFMTAADEVWWAPMFKAAKK